MQIREQGKQVQLIRSPYDPARKRCVQRVAHKFERRIMYLSANPADYLSAEQLADLSDDEQQTLAAWLNAKSDKQAADDRSYAIRFADSNIIRLADAILSDGLPDSQHADRIWKAMSQLEKALKKSGHPRPKRDRAQAATSDQADLL